MVTVSDRMDYRMPPLSQKVLLDSAALNILPQAWIDQLLDLVAFLERHCGLMVSAGAWVSAGPGAFTNKHYAGFLAFLNLSILMKRG